MVIPVGYAQINYRFGGVAAPEGAEITIGVSNPNDDSAADIATAAYNAFVGTGDVLPLLCSSLTLLNVHVKKGPDATGAFHDLAAADGGGDTSPCTGPAVAYLIRKATAIGGRQGRGRMYLPGVAETAVTDSGTVLSTKADALDDAWSSWGVGMGTLGYLPVLLHSGLLPPTPLTTITCDSKVATQRRRQRR